MKKAVQETLPRGGKKPVAGLKPVSRQKRERILPSEKKRKAAGWKHKNTAVF